ncbi:MAG: PEPxxWA-CTERM sorting domain-containing protein, partial [Caulobacterales bacterium]
MTAVPEPSTWAMLMVGVFGVGAALRARASAKRR